MLTDYTFTETSSRNVTENGEQMRLVNFRGTDDSTDPNHRLNVDGRFTMPLMDYFMAGMEGRLHEVIRDKVLERITPVEENKEGEEGNNAE